jgi:hypothetical protein
VDFPVSHPRRFFQQVGGLAPAAARYAGFSSRKALWTALLISGGAAGLAGALEVAGPIGQLTTYVPAGYGFAAIIVAYVGALASGGHGVLSAILMSMFYIGGEMAQSRLGLTKSLTGVFQGLLLFSLLACDTLWFTALPFTEYALHPDVHRYLIGNVLLQNHLTLADVFRGQPVDGVVSGSFWTLPVEMTAYLGACRAFPGSAKTGVG